MENNKQFYKLNHYRFILYILIILSITIIDVSMILLLLFDNNLTIEATFLGACLTSTFGLYSYMVHKIVYFRKKEIKKKSAN